MKTIELLTQCAHALRKEVARLNRRAARIGVDAIQLNARGQREVTRTVLTKTEDGDVHERSYPTTVDVFEVVLPDVGDYQWDVLATLTVMDGEPLLFVDSAVPGFDRKRWERTDPCRCDHCHTSRDRKNLFIVQHRETGDVKQVGRMCFADYVGHDGLLKLEFMSVIQQVFSDRDDWGSSGGRAVELIDVRAVIALAELKLECDGRWIYNVKDDMGNLVGDGTHRTAAKWARGGEPIRDDVRKRAGDEADPIWAKVDSIIERFATLDGLDEFGQSLAYTLSFPVVPARKAGLVAFAGQFLRNLDAKAARQAAAANMRHVGTVGKRETFTGLTVKSVHASEGFYGTTYFCVFADKDGNSLVWRSSNDLGFTDGEVVDLKATVKEHGTFRDVPQTVLTRCKIV